MVKLGFVRAVFNHELRILHQIKLRAVALDYHILSMCMYFYRLLEYSMDGSKVSSQDVTSVIANVAGKHNGHLLAWRFFRMHYDWLYERLVVMYNDFEIHHHHHHHTAVT